MVLTRFSPRRLLKELQLLLCVILNDAFPAHAKEEELWEELG